MYVCDQLILWLMLFLVRQLLTIYWQNVSIGNISEWHDNLNLTIYHLCVCVCSWRCLGSDVVWQMSRKSNVDFVDCTFPSSLPSSHTKCYIPSGWQGVRFKVCHEVTPLWDLTEQSWTDVGALLPLSGESYSLRKSFYVAWDHVELFEVELYILRTLCLA